MSTLNHQRTAFTVASHFERPYGGFILGTKPFIKEVPQGIKGTLLKCCNVSLDVPKRLVIYPEAIFG
jgi:hypothetical protein